MGAVAIELVALVLEELNVAEEIEELVLRLVDPGIGGDLVPAAILRGQVALGPLHGHEIVLVGRLARHLGRDDKGPVLPVDPGIACRHHAQVAGFAEIDPRQDDVHVLQFRLQARPRHDQHEQENGHRRQHAFHQADEAAVAAAVIDGPAAPPHGHGMSGGGALMRRCHAMPAIMQCLRASSRGCARCRAAGARHRRRKGW